MRLKYDADYQRELEALVAKTEAHRKWASWSLIVATAIILGTILFMSHHYQAPTGLMISLTIAASTLCLMVIFTTGITVLQRGFVLMAFTIEWFEKKKLGETIE
ncbi:MAG: hypothetical protein IH999_02330 [Proteobacteria bacterium]|nr:hypothetical protein [Pseudomonadota bacterium]